MERIKNKKVIMGGIVGVAIIVIVAVLFMVMNAKTLALKSDEIQVEFGENIPLEASYYLDSKKVDKDVMEKVSVSTDAPKTSELPDNSIKDCPPVGEYTVILKYSDETAEVKVKVADTTKPTFTKYKKEVGVTKDCNPDMERIISEFQANDLSEVKITVDDSQVDYTKVGKYTATVKATDKYNNEATRELTFGIVEPTIELNKKSDNIYVKENVVLKATIVGKDTKAKFTSSDTGVATVDSNGKVTGKKAGSTTITAEANGVKATCKITVKKVPSGSSTEKQTITNPNTGKQETVTVVKPKPSGGSSSGSSSGGSSSSSTSTTASLNRSMLSMFNQERSKRGLPALSWNSSLESYALTRAKESSEKFSHTCPNGTQAVDQPGVYGEILVIAPNANVALNGWMNSAGHREAILADYYTSVCIAKYGNNWVGLFAE